MVDRRTLSIRLKLNARSVCDFRMTDLTATYRPVAGSDVQVSVDGNLVYGGSIDEPEEFQPQQFEATGGTGVIRRFAIKCASYEQRFDKRLLPINFGRIPCVVNPTTDVITLDSDRGLQNNYAVRFAADNGTLPLGISATTTYYWKYLSSTTGQLQTSPGGSTVDIINAGSGEQRIVWMSGSAVKKIVAFYGAFEGITAGTIADGAPVELAIFDRVTVMEGIDSLARIADYVDYISPAKAFQYIPRTTNAAPFSFTDASSDILSNDEAGYPTFRYTREDYANSIVARIDENAVGPQLVNVNPNGVKRRFELNPPIKSIVDISVAGTPKTVGIYGQDPLGTKDWYYNVGDNWVIQDPAGTTVTSGQGMFVTYRGYWQDIVASDDIAEQSARSAIETGTSGLYERLVDAAGVSYSVAQQLADSELAVRKAIAIELQFATDTPGLVPGQLLTVNSTRFGVNTTFLIDEVNAEDVFDFAHIRYRVRCLSGTRLGDWFSTYKQFLAGGSGSGSSLAAGGAGGGSTSTSSMAVEEVNLSAGPGTATISSTASPSVIGAQLLTDITQSGSGGMQIAWSSQFASDTPTDIPMGPNERARFLFVAKGDMKWHLVVLSGKIS